MTDFPLNEGRSCEGCTLCCKVLKVVELNKPAGQWCQHAETGRGCRIYDARPADICATFFCGYRNWAYAGEHWFPARSKMILTANEGGGGGLAVHVDPGRPSAWREAPFYHDLKLWARSALREGGQVVVHVGGRTIVILPDRDVDLGPLAEDQRVVTSETVAADGARRYEAFAVKLDDPLIAGRQAGKTFTVQH